MFLADLFEKFLKEKTFLVGVSPKTIRSYRQAFQAYQGVLRSGHASRDELSNGKSNWKNRKAARRNESGY